MLQGLLSYYDDAPFSEPLFALPSICHLRNKHSDSAVNDGTGRDWLASCLQPPGKSLPEEYSWKGC